MNKNGVPSGLEGPTQTPGTEAADPGRKRSRLSRKRRSLLVVGIFLISVAATIIIAGISGFGRLSQTESEFRNTIADYNSWLNTDLASFTNAAADNIDDICRHHSQTTIAKLEDLYRVHESYQSKIGHLYRQLNEANRNRHKRDWQKTQEQSLVIDHSHQQTIYGLKYGCPIESAPGPAE